MRDKRQMRDRAGIPGDYDRITRVNEILKREIADVLETRGLNEAGCLISVTRVECSTTLKNAEVYVSLLGVATPEKEEEIIQKLVRIKGDIQAEIARHVVLKYTPVLHFVLDRNIAEGDRVLARLRELEEEDRKKQGSNENQ